MGSIHEDPFGHSSYLIGQYDEERFFPSVVKDKYIRFKVVFDKKYNSSRFNILNEYFIFHFLVDVPEVVKLQLHHYNQIIMQPLLNSDGSMLEYPALYPKSYTYIQVQGLEY